MSGACAKELLCYPPAIAAAKTDEDRARVAGMHALSDHLRAGYVMTEKQEAAYIVAVDCYTAPSKFAKAFAELASTF